MTVCPTSTCPFSIKNPSRLNDPLYSGEWINLEPGDITAFGLNNPNEIDVDSPVYLYDSEFDFLTSASFETIRQYSNGQPRLVAYHDGQFCF